MKTKRKIAVWITATCLCLAVYAGFLVRLNQDTYFYHLYKSSGPAHVSYEKALVLGVTDQDLQPDANQKAVLTGSQNLTVRIITGKRAGTETQITNILNYTTNVLLKQGDTVILHMDAADDSYWIASVFSPNRVPVLLAMLLFFCGCLSLVGGWRGVKSVVGIMFTCATIIFFFIPLLYRGVPPILATVSTIGLIAFMTLFLLNGPCVKTWSAILGTFVGTILAGLIACLFQSLTQISGLNTPEADSLLAIGGKTGLQVSDLLFASILIASLGAVMDIAISIASAIGEVHQGNPKISRRKLFWAGMSVGRDTMGTMANTLILAFTGSSLTLLVMIFSLERSWLQIANSGMIAIEVVKALSGSLGVILTVPTVSFISAILNPAPKD